MLFYLATEWFGGSGYTLPFFFYCVVATGWTGGTWRNPKQRPLLPLSGRIEKSSWKRKKVKSEKDDFFLVCLFLFFAASKWKKSVRIRVAKRITLDHLSPQQPPHSRCTGPPSRRHNLLNVHQESDRMKKKNMTTLFRLYFVAYVKCIYTRPLH